MARTAAEVQQLRREISEVSFWWHAIDLGDGIVTPGVKGGGASFMARELRSLEIPDLNGRTVLDIGAWDGFYSFETERRGAARGSRWTTSSGSVPTAARGAALRSHTARFAAASSGATSTS